MIRLLATFFYLGRFPWMPGTIGTLGAIPLVWLLTLGGAWSYTIGIALLMILAIGVSEAFERKYKEKDSPQIVIDEVIGYVIAMAGLPEKSLAFLWAFIIFRFLDIFKPFPINYIDRHIRGGLGVVADDVLAGILTNLILRIAFSYFPL